jgi:hypothetical protein
LSGAGATARQRGATERTNADAAHTRARAQAWLPLPGGEALSSSQGPSSFHGELAPALRAFREASAATPLRLAPAASLPARAWAAQARGWRRCVRSHRARAVALALACTRSPRARARSPQAPDWTPSLQIFREDDARTAADGVTEGTARLFPLSFQTCPFRRFPFGPGALTRARRRSARRAGGAGLPGPRGRRAAGGGG